jgi:hypothetical protein
MTIKINKRPVERIAKLDDRFDESDADDEQGRSRIVKKVLSGHIDMLEDARFEETKQNLEDMEKSQEIKDEQERLSNEVMSGNSKGYDSHSVIGGTTKHRTDDEESDEESLSGDGKSIRAERDRLAREIFNTKGDDE